MTDNFIQVNKVSCVQGAYPDHLLSEWDKYDKRKRSENDRPGRKLQELFWLFLSLFLLFLAKLLA